MLELAQTQMPIEMRALTLTRFAEGDAAHKVMRRSTSRWSRNRKLNPKSHSIKINTIILTQPMLKNVISCSLVVINGPLTLSCPWSGGAGRGLALGDPRRGHLLRAWIWHPP